MAKTSKEKPAVASDVRRILGTVEDDLVTEVLATGATADEIFEAYEWVSSEDRLGTDLDHTKRGRVAAVYDILVRDAEEMDER
jgi:hypothetical protein